jgi:hypothetical protein
VVEPVKTIAIQSDIVLSDALGTIYTIKGNTISTYNNDGQKLYSYSNPFLGNISFADVKDPMRILLFFKEFNKVVFLSNKLSEIASPIELDNAGYSQVSICCTSNERGFWLFDSQMFQLIHLNENLEPLHKGTLLQHLFKNTTTPPACLLEENDELYMSVPGTGIMIFDKYGSYRKTLPIMNVSNFQIIGEKIIYYQNNYIYSISKEMIIDSISLPAELKIISSSLFKNHLYSSNGDQLFLFNL